jgi:transposase
MGTAAQPVSQPRTKRHYRSADERRRIVEETLLPGTSVAVIARAHGVNANQVFAWRKMYQAGQLGSTAQASVLETTSSCMRLLPVTVTDEAENTQAVPVAVSTQCGVDHEAAAVPGSIELTMAKVQIRITGHVDAGALRVVLEFLRG